MNHPTGTDPTPPSGREVPRRPGRMLLALAATGALIAAGVGIVVLTGHGPNQRAAVRPPGFMKVP